MRGFLALTPLMFVLGSPPSAAADPARYMNAELIAETLSPASGSTTLVGLRMTPRPGWHGYWSNPGESGIAPSVRWTAPKGVTFGPLLHPAPVLLSTDGITSFVHDGKHVLLARMSVSRSFRTGAAIPVVADLRWAACTARQCVPLHAQLKLQLRVGHGERTREWPSIHAANMKLPLRSPDGTFVRAGRMLRLQLPASLKLDPRTTRFFPERSGTIQSAAARQGRVNGHIVIVAAASSTTPASFSGVVTDGRTAYRLTLRRR